MISDIRKEEYFAGEDWTVESALNRFRNFDFHAHVIFAIETRARGAAESEICLTGKSGTVYVATFVT